MPVSFGHMMLYVVQHSFAARMLIDQISLMH